MTISVTTTYFLQKLKKKKKIKVKSKLNKFNFQRHKNLELI